MKNTGALSQTPLLSLRERSKEYLRNYVSRRGRGEVKAEREREKRSCKQEGKRGINKEK